jgi:hypothetical protein
MQGQQTAVSFTLGVSHFEYNPVNKIMNLAGTSGFAM